MCRIATTLRFLFVISLLAVPILCIAEQESEEDSRSSVWDLTNDEIAKQLSNPVNALFQIGNEFEYRSYQGDLPEADDQSNAVYLIKPSWSIPLRNGKNVLLRATIPIYAKMPVWKLDTDHPLWIVDYDYPDFRIRQTPYVTPSSGAFDDIHGHYGDIEFDAAYGGVSDSGFISMFGITGVVDTSSNQSASRKTMLLGPEIALGKETHWGVYGAWLSHLTNVGSAIINYDTNETYIEVFFAYGLGNGWQVFSNPTILYDWEALSGNDLLLPLAVGISKTTRLGKMPAKFSFEIQKYVISPDRFGNDLTATFSFTPVFRNPFRK